MSDLISRQAAIDALGGNEPVGDPSKMDDDDVVKMWERIRIINIINKLPSAQPERLTDDDFETIRIHLNAYKEKLCNQHRWKEAEEYQRIIDRFMGFASQPTIEPRKGKWLPDNNSVYEMRFICSECNESQVVPTTGFTKYKPIWDFCPNCGADMREDENDDTD